MILYNYTDEEKMLFSIPVPNKTKTYTPVNHKDIIDCIYDKLDDSGFVIVGHKYRYNKKGTVLTGEYMISVDGDTDYGMSFAFINSYDKSRRVAFASGVTTFVCLNGSISGAITYKQKHTGKVDIDIVDMISKEVIRMKKEYINITNDFLIWKGLKFTKNKMARALGVMFMKSLLNSKQLNIIKSEIKKPSFNYGTFNDTVYDFYQHCTYSMNDVHAKDYIKNHKKLYDYFKKIQNHLIVKNE